ncbi:alternative ribosome rescue aminoacyl-tRNA hydrolase ArfB [Corynebacterium hindlerae]|uniref:alternative ribosome rescue aminoacyl-tRNA hydrolase ArfB n=1 Tax=Corynebacterium hindlerae TaxID=699041 RepID=UPI0031B69FBC
MDPLTIAPGPGIPRGLVIPAAELRERFARSGGPGGQGVNTTDSKVQLSVDLATLTVLSDAHRRRALRNLAARLDGTVLTVSVAAQRSQVRNRAEARRRLGELLREAVAPPPPKRRPTRPTRAALRRRKAAKQRRSEIKANRRRPMSGF